MARHSTVLRIKLERQKGSYSLSASARCFLRVGCGRQEGRSPSVPISLGARNTWAFDTSAATLLRSLTLSIRLFAPGGRCWREKGPRAVSGSPTLAAAQSWANCFYPFLLFSRPGRVFQEWTLHSAITCKGGPSIYIADSKSAVSKFEPGLRRIMGQRQLAAQRAARCSLIYFFAHQIPRILVLKSN